MTSENKLSTDDVCRIIEACAKSGVSECQFSTLTVRFDRPVAPPAEQQLVTAPVQISAEQIQAAMRSLEAEEIKHREDQIAELQLTDPAAAERLIVDGELEEDDDIADDGSIDETF